MDYFLSRWSDGLEKLKVQIYNQKLQLIYSGQINKGQDYKLKNVLDDCSLLFNTHDTSYFLKK